MNSDPDAVSRPADTMRERVGETRVKIWFLISANRWLVTGVILASTYALLLLCHVFGPTTPQRFVTTGSVSSLFSSMIIATVTSVTLVLSVSQFVLAGEIGPLGQQRERMTNETEFREQVEDAAGIGVSPVEPSRFLRTLIETAETRAVTLNDAVTAGAGSAQHEEITAFTDGLVEHSKMVSNDLRDADFGSFETLLPVLNYNYSWKIFTARTLRDKYDESLSTEAAAAFDDLIDALRFFGPAREHFKTLYVQWEIINISRAVLYGAMPALAIAGYMMLEFDPAKVTGTAFGVSTAYLVVSALYVATLAPFAVLLAYLLRVLTVMKRTLAIGPFILRETEQLEAVRQEESTEIQSNR
ncbi:hypothetical protein CP556_04290 [Natrinema sp. CBA1119]|uniref:hypothetical protein n=1 Tax=Natrinema sp. CBA1119 TaxID=1608465 RepID=UPI000BF90BF9|nr:hypothetical protein [Natrinema sp. CBA1119]PGF15425.1 hypothetical protein CP556_04290 [Natrinema sp. CBA1119]